VDRMSPFPWKRVLIIFVLAFAVRIVFSVGLATHGDANFVSPGDSQAYIAIAHNLIDHGVYSNFENLEPNNHRPPLYPLFLLPFIATGTSYFFIALVQGALVALSAVLFYLLARRMFNEGVVFVAVLMFVLEPNGLLYSALMMSEALFMVFFVPAIFLLALTLYAKDAKLLVFSSACLAFAALARVIALPLMALVPLVAGLVWRWRLPWRPLTLSAALFTIIISPWLAFNVQTFSSLEFSSTGSINLYADNAVEFEQWLYPQKEEYFFKQESRATTVAGAHELGKVALAFILEHPVKYAIFHALYMPRLFIHDGFNDVYMRLTGTVQTQTFSLYDRVATLDFAGIISDVRERPDILASLVAKVGFLAVALLFFIHPFLLWRAGERRLLYVSLFLVAFVFLYAFLVSPVGQARLRFVIHPLLFLLAVDSARMLLPWVLQQLRRRHVRNVQ